MWLEQRKKSLMDMLIGRATGSLGGVDISDHEVVCHLLVSLSNLRNITRRSVSLYDYAAFSDLLARDHRFQCCRMTLIMTLITTSSSRKMSRGY